MTKWLTSYIDENSHRWETERTERQKNMEKTAEEWKRMKRFEKIRTIREKLEENKTITIKLNPPRIHLDTHQAEHCSDQPMPHTTQSEQDRDQAEKIVPSHTDLQEAPRQDQGPHVGDHPEHEAGQADNHEAPHQDVHPHDQHCDQDDHPGQGEDSAGKQEAATHHDQDPLDVQQHEGDLPWLRTVLASTHDEAPCQAQRPRTSLTSSGARMTTQSRAKTRLTPRMKQPTMTRAPMMSSYMMKETSQ